ncbi:MAG: hypothetical protein HY646_13045 [Acidobacteria bacterium]|nr:hypothetical protein [Acidobacteriota bacterium]
MAIELHQREAMMNHLRYSFRLLARNPGFAAASILTVALGIGATTAIFSVVYSVALRPLPYGDPGRLVNIYTRADRLGLSRAFVGAANFRCSAADSSKKRSSWGEIVT